MTTPRPILKRCSRSADSATAVGHHPQPSSTTPHRISNNVRFPPSPTLTRTFAAYSPSTYDRSPIVVGPNTCALPARGCPGRTYIPGDVPYSPDPQRHLKNKGKSLHPRATTAMGLSFAGPSPPSLPPLIPDLSSESDESDGFTSPPHDAASLFSGLSLAIPISATPIPADAACSLAPTPLSFLPHPPCAPHRQQGPEEEHMHHTYEEEKRRRREKDARRERNRWDSEQRARSRDAGVRDLAPSTAGGAPDDEDVDEEDDDDDDLAGRYKTLGSGALSGFALEADDGCLGGF